MKLHMDIETFSSEDIKKCGAYRYVAAPDFEILMLAYAYDDNPVHIIDLAQGEEIPVHLFDALHDDTTTLCAHNATFERLALTEYGMQTDIKKWECTMIKAAYCGFPLSLGMAAKAMHLDTEKDTEGNRLIKYFCGYAKPTKANGMRRRNLPHHDIDKWNAFKAYCIKDVEAERGIDKTLAKYRIPRFERDLYVLDQEINDRGIKVDMDFVNKAIATDAKQSVILKERMKRLTGLENPNSPSQLTKWLTAAIGREITTLAKDTLPELIVEAEGSLGENPEIVKEVIELRIRSSKTSTAKYIKMGTSVGFDGRGRGFFQFYGANRTGRWAGRLVQLQNLPRIYMGDEELSDARSTIKDHTFSGIEKKLGDKVSDTLSQLIRTSFVAEEGYTFAVSDFSAIEARVIAWLASETWRTEVFNGHGKIYEASAAMMFNVPIGEVTKENGLRAKGKVAELALGYQGSVGAMIQMGAAGMGLSEDEMLDIVKKWRQKSPNIVKMWYTIEKAAVAAVESQGRTITLKGYHNLKFHHNGECLRIQLPSGRQLFYQQADLYVNKFDKLAVRYMGMDQTTKQWGRVGTYGGKLTENIVQAIARDILAESMLRLDKAGYRIVLHVHDEVAIEVGTHTRGLNRIEQIMGQPLGWAPGLPLAAEGYLSTFYKKD